MENFTELYGSAEYGFAEDYPNERPAARSTPAPSEAAEEEKFSYLRCLFVSLVVAIIIYILSFLCSALSAWGSLVNVSTGDHGNTLSEYIDNVRGLNYETLAFFDMCNVKYYETTDYMESSVSCHNAMYDLMSVASFGYFTKVHNHPYDAPFSLTDLKNAPYGNPHRLMVVSSDHIYTLEAPNGWPKQSDIAKYSDTILSDYLAGHSYCQDLMVTTGFRINNNGETVVTTVTTNAFMEDFADTFNLVYTAIPIDEWEKAQ